MAESILHIRRDFIYDEPKQGIHTSTLAVILGDMLADAERQFGPREQNWTILGITFHDGAPDSWNPSGSKNVIIRLGADALLDPIRATFQLAHEVAHLLAPRFGVKASKLEEGVSSLFSLSQTEKRWGLTLNAAKWLGSYLPCYNALNQLLSYDADAVVKIRKTSPSLSEAAPAQIRTACPNVPEKLADLLVERM